MTETHEYLRFRWLETLIHDVRYAIRSLRRTPTFTIAALLTLALGVGANTAIFSVVDAVLLRPLPYPRPERIVQLMRRTEGSESGGHTGLRYMFFRDNMRSIESMAAWRGTTGFNLSTGESAEYVKAMPVSKEFFTVFGVRPLYGETFGDAHDRVGGVDAVVLSYGLWTRLFGGNPNAVGSTISLGDRAYTVIGIMLIGVGAPFKSVGTNCHCLTASSAAWSRSGIDFSTCASSTEPSVPIRTSMITTPVTPASRATGG